MEKQKTFNILIIGLVALLLITMIGSVIFITATLSKRFNEAVTPIQNVNDAISSQVSKLLNPTPTVIPDPVTIIREVQSLARLETIQYTVEKVITAEVNQGVFAPFVGDKLLLVAHGYVIAGIDLSELSEEDLRMKNEVLYVDLPEAEIFVSTLDNDKSYVYDRETGLLTKGDVNLETEARQAAEQAIREAAVEDGILVYAEQNAETYVERLLNTLGYLQVVFE
jgi:hypothetical protein